MRGLGIFAWGLAVAGPASAGPWAQAPGGWYAEAKITEEELEGVRGNRVELYGEYGVAPDWTVTAKSEAVAYEIGSQFDKEFWRATLRRQLVSHKGWAVGVEGGLVHGSSLAGVFGCDGWGAEARLSGGLSGLRGGRNFYVFADAVAIRHEDGCVRQRAEFGYGVDIWQDFFISQQLRAHSPALGRGPILPERLPPHSRFRSSDTQPRQFGRPACGRLQTSCGYPAGRCADFPASDRPCPVSR